MSEYESSTVSLTATIDMNGTTDYLEGYARSRTQASGTVRADHDFNGAANTVICWRIQDYRKHRLWH